MSELELIIDLHKDSERQGPGSPADTLRALAFVHLPSNQLLRVADLGCGTGGQTITLAKELHASISALDLFPEFLEDLQERAVREGVAHKIHPEARSMDDLNVEKESLDLIWSEGAIYNLGFADRINKWKPSLKKGGYLAVSEITWITMDRPQEISQFWEKHYPQIDTAAAKIRILEQQGFTLTGYFYLSPQSWLDHYYRPLEQRFPDFLNRHNQSELARKIVDEHWAEINLYRKYQDYYSYGFYVARKEICS
ncbi:MAG: methyltransferase domain-containing protein [Bacteroidota bacterium]